MYVLYVYVYLFFLKNAKLQPSTSKIVLSQSLFLFVSFMFLHPLTSNTTSAIRSYDAETIHHSEVKGEGRFTRAGVSKCQHGTYACGGFVSYIFFANSTHNQT